MALKINFKFPEISTHKPVVKNGNKNSFADNTTVLNLVLNNTEETLILIDHQLTIQLYNNSTAQIVKKLLGIDVRIGMNILDLVHPSRKEQTYNFIQKVLKGETKETEITIENPEGATKFFSSSFRPALNEEGEIIGAIINSKDVTAKRLAEISLIESQQRWRFALEGSNQGLWDWNMQTGECYFSGSYKKLYGFQNNEISNHIEEWEKRIHPDDKYIIEEAFRDHTKGNQPYYQCIYRLQNKEGHYRWVLAKGMILTRDDEGNGVRMIGTHADITQQKTEEENYKLLFYCHPMPMLTYDMDTLQIIEVNNEALRLYGYTLLEFLGLKLTDLRPEEEEENLQKILSKIKDGITRQNNRMWHKKKNGEVICVEVTGNQFDYKGKKARLISIKDITQTIRIENELLTSEKQYKTLFHNNPLPCWIYNSETLQFLEVNKAAVKHYGYAKEEFLQLSLSSLIPEKDRENLNIQLQRENNNKTTSTSNCQHLKKSGESIIVDLKSSFINYNEKNARLVVINDVTEKVATEKELRISNERFILASEAASEALWEWNEVTGEAYISEAYTDMLGWKASEYRKFTEWNEYVHPDDREKTVGGYYALLENPDARHWQDEYRYLKADGSYATVIDRAIILRDKNGKPERIVGAILDITSQKIIEEELRKSNERFDIVMKATHDLIWDWDLETGTFYRDKEGLLKVYGVKDEKEIRNIYNWLQRIHPDDHDHVQKVINDILQAGKQNTFDVEYRFLTDSGNYNHVYDRGIIIRENGRPVRMIGAAQDVTQRKKLEQELLHRELDKQKAIGQATLETQEKERSEIGKELHDNVNQVLTTTKLYLDLTISNPELKDELIQKSSQNIIYVINEIRQLSKSLMDPSLGDLGLINAIEDLIETINFTRKLYIGLEADTEIENVLSENQKLMIFRIVQETLNNTLNHAQASIMQIKLEEKETTVNLIITDDGVGFNIDKIKKGAGLKNIQNRVYLANGSFHIETEPDKGCNIVINFPINTINNPV